MLHGDIRVNGSTIGHWSARRPENLSSEDSFHEYEWEYYERGALISTGTLKHRYSDGAPVLAALVCLAASKGEREYTKHIQNLVNQFVSKEN